MSQTAPHASRNAGLSRVLLWLFWALVIIGIGRFLGRDALHYLLDHSEESYGRFWPRRTGVFLHVIGGFVALAIGPFQFWSGTKRRSMRVHRITGRVYLGTILLGSLASFYLSMTTNVLGPTWGLSLFVLGVVWLSCTVMGVLSIRRRRLR